MRSLLFFVIFFGDSFVVYVFLKLEMTISLYYSL